MRLIPPWLWLCLWGSKKKKKRRGSLPAAGRCHHLYRLAGFLIFSLPFLGASPRETHLASSLSPPPSSVWSPLPGSNPFSARFNLLLLLLALPLPYSLPRTHRFASPPPPFLAVRRFLIRLRLLWWPCVRARRCCSGGKGCCLRGPWRRSVAFQRRPRSAPALRFDRRGALPVCCPNSPTLMRLSHCESYCAAPLSYIPCLPKSKDAPAGGGGGADAVSAAPCPVSVPAAATEDKPPQVQKIEVVAPAAAAADKDDGDHKEHEDGGEKAAAVPLPKSNLKKANCGDDGGVCAPKGNVKWLDLLGKDLTEVKEFEPSESGDSMDDEGISTCVCVIQ